MLLYLRCKNKSYTSTVYAYAPEATFYANTISTFSYLLFSFFTS